MIRRREVIASGLTLSATATSLPVLAKLPRHSLVGAWVLIDVVAYGPDGVRFPWRSFEEPITGLIIYEATGFMSVQIAGKREPLPHDTNFIALSSDQQTPYVRSYYAYFGRYTFNPRTSEVTHTVTSALDPSEIGKVYTRSVELQGKEVTLTTPKSPSGNRSVLRWRRAN